ncbi:hypothetical protein HR51_24475 [Burkholderia cepacia]|nr:hypothetical protein HR51_24475 [Burkholderia cepacia]
MPGDGGCLADDGARVRAARPTGDPAVRRFRPFALATRHRPCIAAAFAGNDTDGRSFAAAA